MIPDSFVDADDIVANVMGDRILRISRLFLDEEGKDCVHVSHRLMQIQPKSHGGDLQRRSTMDMWWDCLPAKILDVILLG
jgi:hypothetical protein